MHPFGRLEAEIEHHYISTRPPQPVVEEKNKLVTYISDAVEYVQDSLKDEIKAGKYSREDEKGHFLENMAQKQAGHKRTWSVFKFGSETWGTSCGDSDVDIAIGLNFRNSRFDKKFVLKSLARVISEGDKDEQLRVKPLLHATYPIIKIHHIQEKSIKLDISIADRFCKRRQDIIRDIIDFYEKRYGLPVRKLVIFIKYWSKIRGINNSYKQFLNSFGFTLLILKFIQSLEEQCLPQFKASVVPLVFAFFQFYTSHYNLYAYSVSVIDPKDRDRFKSNRLKRNGIFEPRIREMWPSGPMMEVMDPANDWNNVAMNVGPHQYDRMSVEFKRACHILSEASMGRVVGGHQSVFQTLTEPYIAAKGYSMYHGVSTTFTMNNNSGTGVDAVSVAMTTKDVESDHETETSTTTRSDSESADEDSADTDSESHPSMTYTLGHDEMDSSSEGVRSGVESGDTEPDLDLDTESGSDGQVEGGREDEECGGDDQFEEQRVTEQRVQN